MQKYYNLHTPASFGNRENPTCLSGIFRMILIFNRMVSATRAVAADSHLVLLLEQREQQRLQKGKQQAKKQGPPNAVDNEPVDKAIRQ